VSHHVEGHGDSRRRRVSRHVKAEHDDSMGNGALSDSRITAEANRSTDSAFGTAAKKRLAR